MQRPYNTPTVEQINRALSLQVTAKFMPERFNLAPGYKPIDQMEKNVLHLLQKYHPGGPWLKN